MNPQQITLTTANPPLTVSALRGQVAPVNEGGYGGWSTVPRPRRKALTQWDGIDPLAITFSIILDGVADDDSVERDCIQIEQMAQPPSKGAEPPIVRVIGFVPHPSLMWVMLPPEWDAAPVWSRSGYRIRQEVTLHLLEYVADDRLAEAPAAEQARRRAALAAATAAKNGSATAAQTSKAKLYVVKAGDSLASIAARLLGSYKRWPEIAALNGVRDPNKLTVGQSLRLP